MLAPEPRCIPRERRPSSTRRCLAPQPSRATPKREGGATSVAEKVSAGRALTLALFLAVLLDVRLGGLVGVVPRVNNVPTRRVRMVRCLLVMTGLMMLGRFRVVSGGVAMMFR